MRPFSCDGALTLTTGEMVAKGVVKVCTGLFQAVVNDFGVGHCGTLRSPKHE
jgi:hypothetical protein